MKEPKAPCLNCPDRTAENPELGTHDCHSECPKYLKFKEEHLVWSRENFKEHMAEATLNNMRRDRFEKWNKAKSKGYVK